MATTDAQSPALLSQRERIEVRDKRPQLASHELTAIPYWQGLNRKSLLRFFLLAELSKRSMHGYEIANAISVCCDGVRPTDAMIYPTLRELEEGGYITCEDASEGGRTRRVCTLTPKGRKAHEAAATAWAWSLGQIESAIDSAGVARNCCNGGGNQECC